MLFNIEATVIYHYSNAQELRLYSNSISPSIKLDVRQKLKVMVPTNLVATGQSMTLAMLYVRQCWPDYLIFEI